jgi:hypothetical protein
MGILQTKGKMAQTIPAIEAVLAPPPRFDEVLEEGYR